ncbi:hypothetical protein AGJ34_05725 [Cronobacter dublinensis subsp. dublinensis]|nr:hypothetical protein [Cronobacter dublinensis subsp. dublinensis]EGT5668166.1 hypothetical protein [Cronobacter dublinensis subsp. dublinensis]EGT5672530.1 hypothetical protein [Cronobacter dublinensis subsp. dublinensis]EGT5676217.1 hypothetical protein [Cronobacter dublinensis subsp. dublinensis]EGT5685519.1 hypothetical protein [Cronobacter dublinensis subsp. dublinensis]
MCASYRGCGESGLTPQALKKAAKVAFKIAVLACFAVFFRSQHSTLKLHLRAQNTFVSIHTRFSRE